MYSLLVVAYRRPVLLAQMLDHIPESIEKIYVFIDRSPTLDKLNQDVMTVLEKYSALDNRIRFRIAERSLGPGKSIPTAIQWGFESANNLLVLEDDCLPTTSGYEYFSKNGKLLTKGYLICGTSPFDFKKNKSTQKSLTLSRYALISGWMVNKETWEKLNIQSVLKKSYFEILKKICFAPNLYLPASFFYASVIRVRRGEISAWDSALCLSMILNNVKALIPNVTLVDNLGLDSVASNTKAMDEDSSNIYNGASKEMPSDEYDFSRRAQNRTNHAIEYGIYGMKLRNLLSPLISTLRLNRDKP